MLASETKRQTACRFDPAATALFMECFDPERSVWVLGAVRRDGAEEWKSFAGDWKPAVTAWLAARYAAGEPVWFSIGDVRAPSDRKPVADDIEAVRYVAAHSSTPDVFLSSRGNPPHAVYQTVYRDFEGLWRLPEAVPLQEARLLSGRHSAGLCDGKSRVTPHPLYAPLPPNFYPEGFSGGGGCMLRMPNRWRPESAKVARPAVEKTVMPRNGRGQVPPEEDKSLLLVEALKGFGINGQVVSKRITPATIVYAFRPPAGVTISRIDTLSRDIAIALGKQSARVTAAPKERAVAIELPRARRDLVKFSDLLEHEAVQASTAELLLALGLGESGEPELVDAARGPHWLIAGTTGSGKSVGLNIMLLSLLLRLPPSECRLLMIDPKFVELTVYNGVPHLLSPVIVDPKKAIAALQWLARQMKERLEKMASIGVRNIAAYNRVSPDPMPRIVVVIDEFAQIILSKVGQQFQDLVQENTQMARAAGIFLIIATQTPRKDVVTGVIKANLPARICFQVASQIDADVAGIRGAETLLSMGDALVDANDGRIRRVQFAFVSDEEVEAYVAELRATGEPDYVDFNETVDCSPYVPEVKSPGEEPWEDEPPVFDAGEMGEMGERVGGDDGASPDDANQGKPIIRAMKWLLSRLTSEWEKSTLIIAEASRLDPPIAEMTLRRAAKRIGVEDKPPKKVGETALWRMG